MEVPTPLRMVLDLAGQIGEQADARFFAGVVAAVSVPTDKARERLRLAGRPFLDPEGPTRPSPEAVDETAEWVILQAASGLTALGGLAGLGGAASVPPEVLAQLVGGLRLAQRLAVVYGLDPETDRGQMVVWRALAAGFEVELPEDGLVAMRVSQVPDLVRGRLPGPSTVAGVLARRMAMRTAWNVARRITRLVPMIALSTAAAGAGRRTDAIGRRMMAVFRRASEFAMPDPSLIEDAVEL